MNLAKIAVASATYAIDRPYDYLVPEELAGRIQPGMRVLVSFGAGNRRTDGIVLALGARSRMEKSERRFWRCWMMRPCWSRSCSSWPCG